MKYKFFIIISILSFFFSCEKKQYLDDNFRNEILKYQEMFPLDEKTDSIFPYYVISFKKIEKDTVFRITKTKAFSKKEFENYEVFKDEKLQPTVIFDFDNLASKLIKEYPERKGEKLLKFGYSRDNLNSYYLYKVKDDNIMFLKEEKIN